MPSEFIQISPVLSEFDFELNGALPAVQTVVATIDIIDKEGDDGYSDLFLIVSSSAAWLSAVIPGASDIDQDVHAFDIDYSLVEAQANQLVPGNYSANVSYTIYGLNLQSSTIDILYQKFNFVSLQLTDATSVNVTPASITFDHTIGDSLPAFKTVTSSGPNWQLETPVGFVLSSQDAGATITENADGSYKATGTGAIIIEVTPQVSILQQVGTENYVGNIKDSNNVVQDTFTITVRVITDETFEYAPNSLSFITIKNVLNAPAQTVTISSALAFTITKPNWLKVTPATGQNYVEISVVPDDTVSLDPGIYNDVITITRNVNESDVDATISVQYEIVDFIKLPGSQGDFWFTLDNKFLEVFTQKTNTYFQLTLTAMLFDFYNENEKTIELPYKIPLFKSQQKFNIGKIVDRLMYRILQYDELTSSQYKPASIQLFIEEIGMGTEVVYNTALLSNIQYVAGLSPSNIINNSCFLDLNSNPTRVTKNSFAFLNILLKTGNYILKLYKNKGWVSDINISAALDNIFTRKIEFTDYKMGDVIDYKIEIDGSELVKTFILLPENKESYHIVWEDDYKLKSALEFTGAFKLANDFENIFQKSYQNEVEFVEKISSITEGKFIGDTGWLFKYDQVRIESLIRAKKAWLILSDGTEIKIVPTNKSINNFDSEKELYAYNVEFTINKDHNAQSYSF